LDNTSSISIALIGPSANITQLDGFGSSQVDPIYTATPKQGLEGKSSSITFNYVKGCDINSENEAEFDNAKNAALISDMVIFVGGLDYTQEGEGYNIGGDRKGGSVQLPEIQQKLIKELGQINDNIVVVLQSAGICAIQNCLDSIKRLIYSFYPGQEGGNALADAFYGNINPGGKLPVSFPKDDSQLPNWLDYNFTNDFIDGFGYRKFDQISEKPEYSFGYGLSYTNFTISNITYLNQSLGDQNITISLDIQNTGVIQGDEVVQLYISAKNPTVPWPTKQLAAFQRISLESMEKKSINFTIGPKELSYWSDEFGSLFIEKGLYQFHIGNSSDYLPYTNEFEITSDFIYSFTVDRGEYRYEFPPDKINIFLYSSIGAISIISGAYLIKFKKQREKRNEILKKIGHR